MAMLNPFWPQINPQGRGGDINPLNLALLATGLGILSRSGPSLQPTSVGQAIGGAGLEGIQLYSQLRQQQLQQAEQQQMRRFREMQMRKLGLEIEQEEALPEQISRIQRMIVESGGALPDGGGVPLGQFTPLPTEQTSPFLPPAAPQQGPSLSQQQLLGPWAGATSIGLPQAQRPAPEDLELARTGATRIPAIEVMESQAQALFDQADAIEASVAGIRNLHPTAQKRAETAAKGLRDRAERINKMVERRQTLRGQGFEVIAETAGLVKGTPEYETARKNWITKQTQFAPPQQTVINLGEREYAKKFGGGIADQDIAKLTEAGSATEGIAKIDELLTHLQTSDAITGLGAEVFNNVERAKALLFNSQKAGKIVSDTELLDAMLGSEVFPMIKALGIGARGLDTPAEREFLRSVMSGKITMNKQTLVKLTEIRRNIAERAINQWNARLPNIPDEALAAAGISKTPIKIPPKPKAETIKETKRQREFKNLPPASQYLNQIIRDTETGKRYRSDGTRWQEIR